MDVPESEFVHSGVRPALLWSVVLAGLALFAGAASSAPTQNCKPTPEDAFGPFSRISPPLRAKIGTGHVLTGVVLSALDCKPIRGARVEFMAGEQAGCLHALGEAARC